MYQVWQDVHVIDVRGEDDLTVVRFADDDGDALLVRFRFGGTEEALVHLPQLLIWSALGTTVTVVQRDDEVAVVDDAALLADAIS